MRTSTPMLVRKTRWVGFLAFFIPKLMGVQFRQVSAPHTRQESRGVVADFLISLEMTRPEILRAVRAGKVLSGFGLQPGQIGAKGLKADDLFKLSTEVKSIDVFWSHSWKTSKFWKIWLLLMLKNGVPACLIGSLVACIFTFLSFMHYLPGWSKEPLMTTPDFDGEYRYLARCQLASKQTWGKLAFPTTTCKRQLDI